ncbi:MAG: methyl-accepting chemotaxis protein [Burkholderiales bacterium]|nr:methyl-accepting chemotaxis protein [Burkholderiales bacterium]
MTSLRSRLIAFVTGIVALSAILLAVISYGRMKGEIETGISQEIAASAQGYGSVVADWVAAKELVVASVVPQLGQADIKVPMQQAAASGGFTLFYTGYADKRMIYSTDKTPPEGYDPTARPWYKLAVEKGTAVVTAPYIAASSKKLVVSFAAPKGSGASVEAVVGADINLEDIVNDVLAIKLRGNGYAFLVGKDGKIIAYPSEGSALKPIKEVIPGFDSIEHYTDTQTLNTVEIDGAAKLLALRPIKGTEWYLGLVIDKSAATAPLRTLVAELVGVLAVMIGIALVLTWVGISRLLQGLHAVEDAMRAIATGEGDLTVRLPAGSRDEVGRIAAAFNQFIDKLREMFIAVQEQSEALTTGVSHLTDTTKHISVDSNKQSEELSSTAATIEEITVSIAHIADNVHDTHKLVEGVDAGSTESAEAVDKVASEIGRIASEFAQLAEVMNGLGARSDQINSIVGVIKEIADQTNLLALNAAIEAARAGEQGRGFAVVADEVRKLAERTTQATVEIGNMIGSVRDDTQSALGRMQSAVQAVDQGVTLANAASGRIQGIRSATGTMVAKMDDIVAATAEQKEATTAMARSAERVNVMAQQTDQSLQDASRTLQTLSTLASSLRGIVGRFRI